MARSKSRRIDVPSLPFSVAGARGLSTAIAAKIVEELGIELPKTEILVEDAEVDTDEGNDVGSVPIETVSVDRTRYLAFAINCALDDYSSALHKRISPSADDIRKRLEEIDALLERLVEKCGIAGGGPTKIGAVFHFADLENCLRDKSRYFPHLSKTDRSMKEFYHNRIVDYREAVRSSILQLENDPENQAAPFPNPTDVIVRELARVFTHTFERRPGVSVSNGTYNNRDKAGPFVRFLSAVFRHAFGEHQSDWPSKSVETAIRNANIDEIEGLAPRSFHRQLAVSFEKSAVTM